jgi:hypothetical protein
LIELELHYNQETLAVVFRYYQLVLSYLLTREFIEEGLFIIRRGGLFIRVCHIMPDCPKDLYSENTDVIVSPNGRKDNPTCSAAA